MPLEFELFHVDYPRIDSLFGSEFMQRRYGLTYVGDLDQKKHYKISDQSDPCYPVDVYCDAFATTFRQECSAYSRTEKRVIDKSLPKVVSDYLLENEGRMFADQRFYSLICRDKSIRDSLKAYDKIIRITRFSFGKDVYQVNVRVHECSPDHILRRTISMLNLFDLHNRPLIWDRNAGAFKLPSFDDLKKYQERSTAYALQKELEKNQD